MKRISVSIILILSCQFLFAQFQFGLSAGINLASTRKQIDANKFLTNTFLPRLNAGIDAGFFFNQNWGLLTGVYYAGKGYRVRYHLDYDSVIARLNYVELPLKLAYRFPGANNALVFDAGLYGAYGFSGRKKFAGTPPQTVIFFSEDYKRFDLGYALESVYQITKSYAAKLSYTHGLLNLDRSGERFRNFVLNFSLLLKIK